MFSRTSPAQRRWNEALVHLKLTQDEYSSSSEAWRPSDREHVQGKYFLTMRRREATEAILQEPFKLKDLLNLTQKRRAAEWFLQDAKRTYHLVQKSSADAQRRGLLPYLPGNPPANIDINLNSVKKPRIDLEEIKRSEQRCGILSKAGDGLPIEVVHAVASITDWNDLQTHSTANVLIAQIRSLLRSSQSPWDKMNLVSPSIAKRVIDTLQWEADYAPEADPYRKYCISCLQALCTIHATIPSSCYLDSKTISKDGDNPISGSASCDIWRGSLALERQPVCLKVLRYFPTKNNRDASFKAYLKEVMVWRQLRHPHILPLLGVNEDLFAPRFCLISPWMRHGNIIEYLQDNPRAAHERLELVIEIADAIQWLHGLQPPVVHADIKGANILISNDMHCYLADFGLAFVIETFNPRSSSSLRRGTVHWLAPEYLDASLRTEAYITSRDMYAFGCTIVEIYTGKPPFSSLMHDSAVIYEVLVNQNQPPRPETDIFPSDDLWSLVLRCLSYDPAKRPEAIFLFQELQRMLHA